MYRCLVFIFIPTLFFPLNAQSPIFVNKNVAGGLQNGSSWPNAFTELRHALLAASAGDVIWVAKGVYKPTDGTNRDISFDLVSGVKVYGGFAGSETALNQRDPTLNETILSGDIGTPGVKTDNAYHVVRGKGLDNSTIFDGFVITGGYSYDEFSSNSLNGMGAGMLLEGAPQIVNSRPLITNCRFERNYANLGGAFCTTWEDPNNPDEGKNLVNPVVRQCEFSHNRTFQSGGAIYINSPSGVTDTFTLEHCIIADNFAYTGEGGGIYFNQTAYSNIRMNSCVFERDTGQLGGGIYLPGLLPVMNMSTMTLDSCVFNNNVSPEGGAILYFGSLDPLAVGLQFYCRMRHCVFDGNKATNASGSAYVMYGPFGGKLTVEVSECIFQNNLSGGVTTSIGASLSGEANTFFDRCIFFNNNHRNSPQNLCLAVNNGASFGSSAGFNKTTTRINNCLFAKNGGGVSALSKKNNYAETYITNCTFFDNNQYVFVKNWDTTDVQSSGFYNDFYIDNCIIWEKQASFEKMFYSNDPSNLNMFGYRVNHSLLSLEDSTGLAGSLEAFGDGLIFDQYPMFADTATGDFRLQPCSPAVNVGNNLPTLTAGLLTDLDSSTRILYDTVDMGAYEQQDSCNMIATTEAESHNKFYLWPNPSADGILYWQIPEPDGHEGTIRLFDLNGREVYAADIPDAASGVLRLGHLPAGVYMVRIGMLGKTCTGKWVKI